MTGYTVVYITYIIVYACEELHLYQILHYIKLESTLFLIESSLMSKLCSFIRLDLIYCFLLKKTEGLCD